MSDIAVMASNVIAGEDEGESEIAQLFDKMSYGLAPEADNVVQVSKTKSTLYVYSFYIH